MRLALVQSEPVFGDAEKNVESLCRLMDSAQADLYVLPELCTTGYQFRSRNEALDLAETPEGPAVSRLRNEAARRDAAIVFGFAESAGSSLFNSSLAALPDGTFALYRKTHLFHRETLVFDRGDTGFPVFDFRGARVGMAICFDWIFPESFRTLALKGSDIVAHCSNLVLPFCQRADFTRAIENRVFVATANRVGLEDRLGADRGEADGRAALRFTGESVLVSPLGDYILRLDAEKPDSCAAMIDPELARDKSINPYNNLVADRRPEFYAR